MQQHGPARRGQTDQRLLTAQAHAILSTEFALKGLILDGNI